LAKPVSLTFCSAFHLWGGQAGRSLTDCPFGKSARALFCLAKMRSCCRAHHKNLWHDPRSHQAAFAIPGAGIERRYNDACILRRMVLLPKHTLEVDAEPELLDTVLAEDVGVDAEVSVAPNRLERRIRVGVKTGCVGDVKDLPTAFQVGTLR
jgi:hypothetical protein